MAKTGAHLKIISMGDKVMGVRLEGNPKKPEPDHFRIVFPFGDVDIVRCTDNTYWIHVRRNTKEDLAGLAVDGQVGSIQDARLDIIGRHTADINIGEFNDPNLDHLAVRLGPARKE